MLNIFTYLYDKKGKNIPFLFKLKNDLPLTDEELIVDGDLDLAYCEIKSLPDNLTVNGYLDLYASKITYLPNNLTVNGRLNLNFSEVRNLPNNLTVNNNLYCWHTPLADNIKNDPSLLKQYSKQIKGSIVYG